MAVTGNPGAMKTAERIRTKPPKNVAILTRDERGAEMLKKVQISFGARAAKPAKLVWLITSAEVVECHQKKTEISGQAATVGYAAPAHLGRHTVRIRLDNGFDPGNKVTVLPGRRAEPSLPGRRGCSQPRKKRSRVESAPEAASALSKPDFSTQSHIQPSPVQRCRRNR